MERPCQPNQVGISQSLLKKMGGLPKVRRGILLDLYAYSLLIPCSIPVPIRRKNAVFLPKYSLIGTYR